MSKSNDFPKLAAGVQVRSGFVLSSLGPPIRVWGLGFGPNQGLRSGVWALPEPEVWGLAAAQGTPPRPGCTYLQHRVVYWQDW